MELHIILGPMFSGKSTKLIELYNINAANTATSIKESALIINHASDNRYGVSEIATHDQLKLPCISLGFLSDIFTKVNIAEYTHIFIDEGQFFIDLLETVKRLLIKYKKTIYLAGLDGDYKQSPFSNSGFLELIPYATTVTKLTAKCYECGNLAQVTKRISASTQQILVGGANDYVPACLNHIDNLGY